MCTIIRISIRSEYKYKVRANLNLLAQQRARLKVLGECKFYFVNEDFMCNIFKQKALFVKLYHYQISDRKKNYLERGR